VKRRTRPPNKYTPLDIQKLQKNHTLQTAKLEQEVHVDDDMNHKKPEARPTGDCDDAGVNQQRNGSSNVLGRSLNINRHLGSNFHPSSTLLIRRIKQTLQNC
jgi:hypothetical protein